MKFAFNNEKYLKIQKEAIQKRIKSFGGKLYLEFGGKLFDDYHASRVLPGFEPDSKLQMLLTLKEKAEIIIAINAFDIEYNKIRHDLGITYQQDVERLIECYKRVGLYVSSVVLCFYSDHPYVSAFTKKIKKMGINVYKHYHIEGYPRKIETIFSKDGFEKNDYIKTTKELVVVTAPGPGSGKMAVCLSQLYHDMKNGIKSGYAKYETFPIWNLPLKDPVNLAYEAATVELNDVNMIDPFHLEAYGKTAVNYNRDIEVFPLLKVIFENIYGKSPYKSPTDMGVNMAGFAINDEKATTEACKQELIRRYYQTLKANSLGTLEDICVEKMNGLLSMMNITPDYRKTVNVALEKGKKTGVPVLALELNDGHIETGKESSLLGAVAACVLNCLKYLANIDDKIPLISADVIKPIQDLKTEGFKKHNPHIKLTEILIALAIQATSNPLAKQALEQLPNLKGCEAHSTCMLSENELNTLKSLGINVTEEPVAHKISHVVR